MVRSLSNRLSTTFSSALRVVSGISFTFEPADVFMFLLVIRFLPENNYYT